MSDIEHDSQEEFGGAVGAAPKLTPEPSDSALDRLDMLETLERQKQLARGRQQAVIAGPADRALMLAERYKVRLPQEEARLEAENEKWLSPDNEELFTRL